MKTKYVTIGLLLAFAIFLLVPFITDSGYLLHIFIMIFLYAYLASGWNISGGFLGLHSFGHAAFVGVGAYTSSFLFIRWGISPWLGMWVGAFLAGCLGLLIGYLSVRYEVKGIYFTLVTLAFAEIFRIGVLNIPALGASSGLLIPLKGEAPGLFQFAGKKGYYFVAFAMLNLMLIVQLLLRGSKLGYYFLAIRENEDASQALGINIIRGKLLGIGLSAFLVALGGTLWAQYYRHIDPQTIFGVWLSIEILIYAIVGGEGTILGPTLGAIILVPFSEFLRSSLGGGFQGVHLIIYGSILILILMFSPRGISGLIGMLKMGKKQIRVIANE